jgi:hypothetical protein
MAKTDYSDKLKSFADRVKTEEITTPQQKVVPVAPAKEDEQQLNVWIPATLMKKLKLKAVNAEKNQKEITIEALEQYLA